MSNAELEQAHDAGYCEYYVKVCEFCNEREVNQYYEETEHGLPF